MYRGETGAQYYKVGEACDVIGVNEITTAQTYLRPFHCNGQCQGLKPHYDIDAALQSTLCVSEAFAAVLEFHTSSNVGSSHI